MELIRRVWVNVHARGSGVVHVWQRSIWGVMGVETVEEGEFLQS